MSDELKPCPFCGGKAVLIRDRDAFKIYCTNRSCDAQYGWCADEEYTIDGWNRRNHNDDL